MHARRTHRAFTLLEIVVALGVFAVIGVLSSRILMGMADVSTATADHGAALVALQRAMLVMERDVEQLVHRTVRDEFGDRRAALAVDAEALLELTRRGWQNPLGAPPAELQRVAYLLRDGKLLRLFWPVLDRATDTEPIVQVLLEGVEEADFLAHDDSARGHRTWPTRHDEEENVYLAAIEMQLKHTTFGRIRRLWLVPSTDAFLASRRTEGRADEDGEEAQDAPPMPAPTPEQES